MGEYSRSIAISGTHGKTTTSAMIAQMLTAAGVDPTAVIGGDVPDWSSNARVGSSDVFVAEACEAYGSFLELFPLISVITNVESDHLDHYADITAIKEAFKQLLDQTSYYAVICADSPDANSIAKERDENVATYGTSADAQVRATNIRLGAGSSYTVEVLGNCLGEIELSVPGLHNVVNSLAAVTVGNLLDIPFEQIAAGLKSFRGTGRRFEVLGRTESDILVIDDYAHHPTELRATLAAAKSSFPERRILAIFQPHLPSRTRDLMDDFAASFSQADVVLLTDIYLSREKALPGIDGSVLAKKTASEHGADCVVYIKDKFDLSHALTELARPGDLVITLGAGDIRLAGEGFLLAARSGSERLLHV